MHIEDYDGTEEELVLSVLGKEVTEKWLTGITLHVLWPCNHASCGPSWKSVIVQHYFK